jgi:hypothetical protein
MGGMFLRFLITLVITFTFQLMGKGQNDYIEFLHHKQQRHSHSALFGRNEK